LVNYLKNLRIAVIINKEELKIDFVYPMKKQENWKKAVLKRYKPSTHVATILVEG